jgi:hypothetical protein
MDDLVPLKKLPRPAIHFGIHTHKNKPQKIMPIVVLTYSRKEEQFLNYSQ